MVFRWIVEKRIPKTTGFCGRLLLHQRKKSLKLWFIRYTKHAIETESRVPLNDFYDSNTGIRDNFKARSVVGGFYMKMLADKLAGK
jgi:hypothetical protein